MKPDLLLLALVLVAAALLMAWTLYRPTNEDETPNPERKGT